MSRKDGVPVWERAELPENVKVGEGCELERGPHTFERFLTERRPGLTLGRNVRSYQWTTFSVDRGGSVEVGDDSVLVGAAFMCAERIVLGRRVLVSYNVTIADSDFHPLDPELRRRDAVANSPTGDRADRPSVDAQPVLIDDDVEIGIGAIILKGARIGAGARVGAGAVVTGAVASSQHVEGNPARPIDA
jgi:acetyltransferase-like isoleucine patch superfamily enzyme